MKSFKSKRVDILALIKERHLTAAHKHHYYNSYLNGILHSFEQRKHGNYVHIFDKPVLRLERTEEEIFKELINPTTPKFSKIAFPVIRRVMPGLVASQLVSSR